MNTKCYVIPLGHNRYYSILVRDGQVDVRQLEGLISSDGLGLQLVEVDDFTPESLLKAFPPEPVVEPDTNVIIGETN